MNTKARKKTDKLLQGVERRISGFYDKQSADIGKELEAYLDDFSEDIDEHLDDIRQAETQKDKKEAERSYRKYVYGITLGAAAYRAIVKKTSEKISGLNQQAAKHVNGQLRTVYETNYTGMASELNNSAGRMVMASEFIRRNLSKDETNLPYKVINGKKDVRWNTQKINSQIMQGIIDGESIPKMAKRLENVLEMNRDSAIRNARTAVTCTENRARADMLERAEELGIHTKKVWMATLDERTRDAHAELNGEEADIDEPFVNEIGEIMFPGDPDADPANVYNCRCTLGYHILEIEGASGGG